MTIFITKLNQTNIFSYCNKQNSFAFTEHNVAYNSDGGCVYMYQIRHYLIKSSRVVFGILKLGERERERERIRGYS